ncbi:MAG TPA: DUF2231 domain-containing protein [Candidatus Binataceae bacterium]|nr:DUF2231 domain-containing protein [Candidatus Binataceae bacterium]
MVNVLAWLKTLQLHPDADHFTIALLIVAVFIDLIASLAPARMWLRYMALTLMVLGAVATAVSWVTGGLLQPGWVFKAIPPEAKALMHRHARLGYILIYVFAALAIWRILIQALNLMARTRTIYLIVAVIAVGVICYQGHLGGTLVYDYGVGTAPLHVTATPTPAVSTGLMNPASIPTVTVPPPAAATSPAAASIPSPVQSPAQPPATPTATPTPNTT